MTNDTTNGGKPTRQQPIDPLLQQRLQQLAGRPGTPLPPPVPGSQQQPAARVAPPAGASADAAARIAALAARGNSKPGAGKPAPAGKRAKPARAAKMASLTLSAVTTLGLAAMFANQDGSSDSIQLTNGTVSPLVTTAASTATADTTATTTAATAATAATADDTSDDATASTTAATTATTAATTAATTGIADGTYVGDADSNRWGTVQVQVVYSGGQIVDVQILQYPDGENKSVRINQQALPTLISEAISAQSADVDTVSGATYTSDSYKVSLQSAIDAAKAASGVTG